MERTNQGVSTVMPPPPPQAQQSLDPRDYKVRIIVAGSRGWDNRKEFHNVLCAYLKRFEGEDILFISGDAPSGADRLIIEWCRKFGYPCKAMPAEWDNPEYKLASGKSRAGFVRNTTMAKIATHLLCFFNGVSPGTAHMIDEAVKENLSVKIASIKIDDPDTKKILANSYN